MTIQERRKDKKYEGAIEWYFEVNGETIHIVKANATDKELDLVDARSKAPKVEKKEAPKVEKKETSKK